MSYRRNPMTVKNEVAGAVAMEALVDLRVNTFAYNGFPSIVVSQLDEGGYSVSLFCGNKNEFTVNFSLPEKEAYAAAKNFKMGKRTGHELFEIVQESLAELDAKSKRK